MRWSFLTLAICATMGITNAQVIPFSWAKVCSSTGGIGGKVAIDSQGNVVSAGSFDGTVDFDPGPGVLNQTSATGSLYILKLDADGEFLWVMTINGDNLMSTSDIELDLAGSIYVSGVFYGTVDFDPGPAIVSVTASDDADSYVLKLDTNGNFGWVQTFGGIGLNEISAMALDTSGNILLTGHDNYTIHVTKLDTDGDLIWNHPLGDGMLDQGRGIAADAAGNVYVTGDFDGSGDFDPGAGVFTLTSINYLDLFIVKLDPDGNFTFAKQIGGMGYFGSGYDIVIDAFGNILTTGTFDETMDFDPGPATFDLTAAGFSDTFISKLDASGNFIWAKVMGGISYEEGYSLATDAAGNVYSTGYYLDDADFDPGAGIFTLPGSGGYDAYTFKLDKDGNFGWATSVASAGTEFGNGVATDDVGNVYSIGSFQGTIDFDPGSPVLNLTGDVGSNLYIQKFGSNNPPGPIIIYNAVSPNGDGANDILYIDQIAATANTMQNRMTVFNRNGQVVFQTTDYDNVNRVFKGLTDNGDPLPTGTYFYRIDFPSGLATKTGFISLRK